MQTSKQNNRVYALNISFSYYSLKTNYVLKYVMHQLATSGYLILTGTREREQDGLFEDNECQRLPAVVIIGIVYSIKPSGISLS